MNELEIDIYIPKAFIDVFTEWDNTPAASNSRAATETTRLKDSINRPILFSKGAHLPLEVVHA